MCLLARLGWSQTPEADSATRAQRPGRQRPTAVPATLRTRQRLRSPRNQREADSRGSFRSAIPSSSESNRSSPGKPTQPGVGRIASSKCWLRLRRPRPSSHSKSGPPKATKRVADSMVRLLIIATTFGARRTSGFDSSNLPITATCRPTGRMTSVPASQYPVQGGAVALGSCQ